MDGRFISTFARKPAVTEGRTKNPFGSTYISEGELSAEVECKTYYRFIVVGHAEAMSATVTPFERSLETRILVVGEMISH